MLVIKSLVHNITFLVEPTVGPELHDVSDDIRIKMRKLREEYRDEGVRVFLLVGGE